jgi:copper chaperone CopZ
MSPWSLAACKATAEAAARETKLTMDPSDPHNPERADHPILETIEIGTEGEDCDECVAKLRGPLMRIEGVRDVKIDLAKERVIVTFDTRKTHAPSLHDAILKSGYKPSPVAD